MAKNTVWQDDYWLPVMQLYLRKPVGLKPTYSRDVVDLSVELHVAPAVVAEKMQQIATLSTPRVERIWKTYSENPRQLKRAVRLWREMRGFGAADSFYEGVDVTETFEHDFRQLDEEPRLTPAALILILNLYFQLTPITMVVETPEVMALAKRLKTGPQLIVDVLKVYQQCDPFLNRSERTTSCLLPSCQKIWKRFGNGDSEQLSAFANELIEYYR